MKLHTWFGKLNTGLAVFLTVVVVISSLPVIAGGCDETTAAGSTDEIIDRPEGWTEETHSNTVDPDYETVFPQNSVNTIKITVTPEKWESLQQNMIELYGEPGTGQQMFPRNDAGVIVPGQELPPRDQADLPIDGQPLPRDRFNPLFPGTDNMTVPEGMDDVPVPGDDIENNLPGWARMTEENPEWVTATIEFDGITWTDVGFRYKGNSSLTSSWRQGSEKIPFKLDFDEFEDEYPEIDNQRFYGFKQLSFANAFNDPTYLRDVLASDLLQESGLPAAETAWYNVIIDYGEGEVDLGLYILTEVVDDTAIDRYFGDDSGNIYEGDGRGVSLARNIWNLIADSFQKENNTKEADWSDIEDLYTLLHDESRSDDPKAWRTDLESIFDVNAFLEWLAIAAVVQHWDTYGSMTHNFYLYNDPETGKLTWISWDHNDILAGGRAVPDRAVAGIRPGRTLTLGRDEVTDQWPLIRYLLDDPVYHEKYISYLDEFVNGVFEPDTVIPKIQSMADILAPNLDRSERSSFAQALTVLKQQIVQRYQATQAWLEKEAQ